MGGLDYRNRGAVKRISHRLGRMNFQRLESELLSGASLLLFWCSFILTPSPPAPIANLWGARVAATYNSRAASCSSSPLAGMCTTPGRATKGNSRPLLTFMSSLVIQVPQQHPVPLQLRFGRQFGPVFGHGDANSLKSHHAFLSKQQTPKA